MIVIDSSALICIAFQEERHVEFAYCIAQAEEALLSAINYVESSMVVAGRKGEAQLAALDAAIEKLGIAQEAVSLEQMRLAKAAFLTYGKGRHAAGLNICDCFAYALAKAYDAPLLFKGDDFAKTDIASAMR